MKKLTDIQIASVIALVCLLVYGALFVAMYNAGSAHGRSVEQMIASPDSVGYITLARTMLSDHRFALTATSAPDVFRTPGYPAFLALLFSVSSSLLIVPFAQLLLTAYAASLTYFIGVRFFSRPVAIAAALLYLIDPIVFLHTWFALSETLFMALFLSGFYLMLLTTKRHWLIPLALSGILIGLAILVRPIGLYMTPFIALMGVVRYWPDTKKCAIGLLTILLCAFVVLVPWMIRNEHVAGHFALSPNGTYTLWYYDVAGFKAAEMGKSIDDVHADMFAEIGTSDSDAQQSFAFTAQEKAVVRAAILSQPFAYARYHVLSTAPFFFGTSIGTLYLELHDLGILSGSPQMYHTPTESLVRGDYAGVIQSIFSNIPILLERLVWLFAWLSLFAASWIYRRSRLIVFVLGTIALVGILALIAGPVANPRYRIPIEPFLFLIAMDVVATFALWIRHRFI